MQWYYSIFLLKYSSRKPVTNTKKKKGEAGKHKFVKAETFSLLIAVENNSSQRWNYQKESSSPKRKRCQHALNGDLHEFQYLFRISMGTEGLLSPSAICGWWRKTFSDHPEIGAMISEWSSKFFVTIHAERPSVTIQILKRILKLMRVTSVYGSTIHVYHRSRLV